jgi:hypothetical protein
MAKLMGENRIEFDAVIIKQPGIDAAYIEIPFDVEKTFGADRVKVKAWFDNFEYRGSIMRMGTPCHILGLTKTVRKAINKNPGDKIHVAVQVDSGERIVPIPEDFRLLLEANTEIKPFFEALSFTNRKEYCVWISSAKKTETRQARLQKALELLRNHRRNPSDKS